MQKQDEPVRAALGWPGIFYSKELPTGWPVKFRLNLPGDLPGYICIDVFLYRFAVELI